MAEQRDSEQDESEVFPLNKKREERKNEWGTQFDIWLIRAAKKDRPVILVLSPNLPGQEGEITAIPKRIDQYFIQFSIDGEEYWINKNWIGSCKSASSKSESIEQNSEEKVSSGKVLRPPANVTEE